MAKTKSNNSPEGIIEYIKSTNIGLILVILAAVAGAYYIGSLSAEVKYYRENLGANPNIAGAGTGGGNQAPQAPPAQPTDVDLKEPSSEDHIRGDANSNIALVEYSDFDCPYCTSFHQTAKRAVEELGIMWVYRHFPLTAIHPEAETKAIASECVSLQGGDEAFWEFTDILFDEEPTAANLTSVVTRLGLDAGAFDTCVENAETKSAVDEDVQTASNAGVNGTPGNFIINLDTGDIIPLRGAVPFGTVQETVESIR